VILPAPGVDEASRAVESGTSVSVKLPGNNGSVNESSFPSTTIGRGLLRKFRSKLKINIPRINPKELTPNPTHSAEGVVLDSATTGLSKLLNTDPGFGCGNVSKELASD
jgi:hypothetical protein